jgi:putative ABC transport system permease protein
VTLFGAGALVLVFGGIYALTLFSILKRTREIGVRAALGASQAEILGDAIRRGLRPLAAGILVGLAVAVPSLRFMQNALNQELSVSDLPTLALVLAVLVCAAVLAAIIPARHATKVSPLVAMRS